MDTVFGLYVCQKWTYQPEGPHAIFPGMILLHIVRFFEHFENFGLWEKVM